MGVNLLPQASAKDFKKADSSLRGLVILVVWVGVLIVIFVALFFNKGIENGRLKEATIERANLLNKIQGLGQVQDRYYTLAYKSLALSRIKTEQYVPSTINNYIKAKIDNKGKISKYYFDARGSINIRIDTQGYFQAVSIWHNLLADKTVVTELNLSSFTQGTDGVVSFELRGALNLSELYKQNGIVK